MSTATSHRLVTIAEARALLGGVSRGTVYRFLRSNRLTALKIGRRTLIKAESINELIDAAPRFGASTEIANNRT